MTPLSARPHRVYRCYDETGTLIYIGCTVSPIEHRMRVHRKFNPAVAERTARWTTEEYPDRESALAAEAQAIYREAPLLNIRHNAQRVPRAGQTITPTQEELRAAIDRLPSEVPA